MLVAVSGSQGSGKSTVLAELQNNGFKVVIRKTSRSILTDWDKTLNEVKEDPDVFVQFQQELLRRKMDDEKEAIESSELWFTERTTADLFSYMLITLGENNEYTDVVDRYYIDCLNCTKQYSSVFYLSGGLFNVEADGVRGSNMKYSRMVDVTMLDVTKQMFHPSKLSIIDSIDLNVRVKTITAQALSIC